jgi:hypothetical protein
MNGEGTESAYQGAQDMNEMFKALGLEHTYQNLPYEAREYLIGTLNYTIKGGPKEEGPAPFTDADPMLRTTPREMSTVFHALYRCSQGNGPLLELYPETLTPERCTEMLLLMRLRRYLFLELVKPEALLADWMIWMTQQEERIPQHKELHKLQSGFQHHFLIDQDHQIL